MIAQHDGKSLGGLFLGLAVIAASNCSSSPPQDGKSDQATSSTTAGSTTTAAATTGGGGTDPGIDDEQLCEAYVAYVNQTCLAPASEEGCLAALAKPYCGDAFRDRANCVVGKNCSLCPCDACKTEDWALMDCLGSSCLDDTGGACTPMRPETCEPGEACDMTTEGQFYCFPPPNNAQLGEPCSIPDNTCANGMACLGVCRRYCCNDGDCQAGEECTVVSEGDGFVVPVKFCLPPQ